MAQVTVFSDARRRREWSDEERLEILREAFAPGAVVARVARRYDVSRGLIYIWRREALRRAQSAFVPAVIEDAAPSENTGNKRGHGSAGSTGLKMGQSC